MSLQKTVEEILEEKGYTGEHQLGDAHIVDLPKTEIPEDLKDFYMNGIIKIKGSYSKN